MSVLDSHNNIMNSSSAYGMVSRVITQFIPAVTTAATTTCGLTSRQRYPASINVFGGTTADPSLGTGVTQVYLTDFMGFTEDTPQIILCGIEYNFGTMSGVTDTYTDSGVSMPSKTIRIEGADSAVQTAALVCHAVVTTAFSGTGTYTYAITYTNQDGTTGRTATIVVPNGSALYSAFDLIPHLQAGDTAIRDITACALTAGNPSAGVLTFYGLLPLAMSQTATVSTTGPNDILSTNFPMFPIANTDEIAFYSSGQATSNRLVAYLALIGDY
jgi:hypothetical protein